MKKLRVIVVMPAYKAEKTLEKTYRKIPKKIVDEVILVDDASPDKTITVARKLGIRFFVHKNNLGYGGNQKTCYKNALRLKGDIIIMLHPDYQYDPTYIESLIQPIIHKRYDIMLGSRVKSRSETLNGGMPVYKYFGNRLLTLLENLVLGLNLSEYHTGFRAFSKNALTTINIEKFSNDFIFDQEILIAARVNKLSIGEIAIPCIYANDSSSISFSRSVKYGLEILVNLFYYIFDKKRFI